MSAELRKDFLEFFEVLGHLGSLVEKSFFLVGSKYLRHGLFQALKDTAHRPDTLPPSGFRTIFPSHVIRHERLEKYPGIVKHLVAGRAIRPPVMIVKGLQLPRAQGLLLKLGDKPCRRFRVGARQRRQDAAGGPVRNRAGLNLPQHLVGQGLEKIEVAFDPGFVPAEPSTDLAKRLLETTVQFLDKPREFDRFQRPGAAVDQQLKNRLLLARIQPLDRGAIPPQNLQCRKALIAIDQHQPIVLGRHHQQRLQLTVGGY